MSAQASALLFRGLEALERMVASLRATGEPPHPADPALIAELSGQPASAPEPPPKKT
jgi:hypothetical protein